MKTGKTFQVGTHDEGRRNYAIGVSSVGIADLGSMGHHGHAWRLARLLVAYVGMTYIRLDYDSVGNKVCYFDVGWVNRTMIWKDEAAFFERLSSRGRRGIIWR